MGASASHLLFSSVLSIFIKIRIVVPFVPFCLRQARQGVRAITGASPYRVPTAWVCRTRP